VRTVVTIQTGSHLYGTNLPTSDTDFKGIHIPASTDILLQRVKPVVSKTTKRNPYARNTAADTDFESFALHQFMKLLLEGQTGPLDMLFAPDRWVVEASDTWRSIVENQRLWLSRDVSALLGYCRQQSTKYGVRSTRISALREVIVLLDQLGRERAGSLSEPLRACWGEIEGWVALNSDKARLVAGVDRPDGREIPVRFLEVCGRKVHDGVSFKQARDLFQKMIDRYGERSLQAEQNQGVDWKAAGHAVRVITEAEELLTTGQITFSRPDAPLLLRIRGGEVPFEQVVTTIEEGYRRVEECISRSPLPEHPDHAAAEELIRAEYRREVVER